MNRHFCCTTTFAVSSLIIAITQTFRFIRSYDICPQQTCGTELRNFKEVIGADTEVEFYLFSYYSSGNTGISQLIHVFITPS